MDLSSFFTGGVSDIVKGIGNIISQFHLSPDEQAKITLQAQQLVEKKFEELQNTIRTTIAERADIIKAELASGDNYTRRARPTIAYAGLLYIGINQVLFPIAARIMSLFVNDPNKIKMLTAALPALPTSFWTAWAGVVGSWVIGRTFEKTKVNIKTGNDTADKLIKTVLGQK